MPGTIQIDSQILRRLIDAARMNPTEECCGLLAGRDAVITAIFPARNAFASATRYEIAPEELFRFMRAIREAGLELLGIYHSHPRGENCPSPRDIGRAYYPDVAYFILSLDPNVPHPVRAFSIRDGKVEELSVQVV